MTLPLNASKTRWVIIQNNELLLKDKGALLHEADHTSLASHFIRQFKLGCFNHVEYYCAEIPQATSIPTELHTLSLRAALLHLNQDEFEIVIKAHSIINWDKNHQFCGRCGEVTTHESKAFERHCVSCGLTFFPRISPSIIVLIKKGNHLLMARGPHFLPGVYALIAGFIEPGESVEEAVHREVKEEVGLQIKNLSYVGSQPWPFPDSLMIAFTADYASGEIVTDQEEIEEANWYRYDNLPGRPSMSISIASKMIDDFVNFCQMK